MRVPSQQRIGEKVKTETQDKTIRPDFLSNKYLFWSYREACEYSGLAMSTVYNLVHRGKVKSRAHGKYRIDRVSFDRYLSGGK